ncbi:MAG: hypothetical protein D4R43_00710 [Sphingobacteriales bacterium]|nr:MAG: hypothetical protein D4R43_00710 [Sphingobacteriales bacterium]
MSCLITFTNRAVSLSTKSEAFRIYSEKEFSEIELTWNSLVVNHPHLHSSHLNSIRKSTGDDMRFYFIIFSNEKGENIGAAYFQLLSFDHRHYKNFFTRNSVLNWMERKIIDNRFSILVCGSLFSIEGSGYCFKSDLTIDLAQQLNSGIKFLAKKIRASSLLIKDILDYDVEVLSSLGLNKYDGDKTMQLFIPENWNSIADYEHSLKHKYAQRFRSIRKKLTGISISEFNELEIKLHQQKLFSLFENIVEKQTIRLGKVHSNYFSELKKVYGDAVKIFGFFKKQELIAFVIHRLHEETKEYEIHFVGFDELENQKHSLYFNILFHGIEQAIFNKCTCLEMGRTAIEAKSNLGAIPRKINGYFYFYNPIARRLFNILQKAFLKNTESKFIERHPFKPV